MNSPLQSYRRWVGRQVSAAARMFLAALLLLSALTVPAWAQDDDERPKTVIEDEVFVQGSPPDIPSSNTVAAKLPLSLRETPASVSVVDAELLEQQDAQVMGDALRNVSGVNVQSVNGVSDFFVVRGLDSVSSGLILTDGAPEPETTFYQLYNVERVEVLKGPSAFLYGGSPLGGTVNLVRKQPLAGGDFTRLSLRGGSFGTYEGTLDTNFVNDDGDFSFRLNGLFRSSDGYRDDKDSEIFAINPSFTWRPSERTSVTVNLETVDSEYKTDAGLPVFSANPFGGPQQIADVPRTRSYQSPFDISDQQLDRVQIDIQSDVSDTFTLRNKTWYRSLDWESRGTIFNGVFPVFSQQLLFRSLLSLDDDQTLYGNQLEGLWRLETGSVTHNLLLGVEISRLTDEFTFNVFNLPPLDLNTPFETAQQPLFPIPGQALGADAKQDVIAPYIVDQITFSEHFQLLLGARWDNLDFQDDAQRFAKNYDEVSPMIGVVVSPSEAVSLYANYSEAFAPPSTFGIAANLEPEESEQIEAGVKAELLDGRVQMSLAAFRVDRLNIAIPDAFGITRQNGDQRAEGLEFEIGGELAPGLRASLAYAYTDAELTNFAEIVFLPVQPPQFFVADYTGNTPAFTPEHLLNLWVSQRFDGGFTLAGGVRYVGEQFIDEDNGFELDDYVLLDASLAYDFGPWELQVNLRNLTDEEYFTRGFGNTSVLPAPGFEAHGGVAVTF